MMTDNITSGKGIGSSLSGAISSKFKASATGIKEKFDPMNIAKFMTGGSRLAPAILGRLTGRKQSDINYFAGDKNKRSGYTQMPSSMSTPGGGLGGSAVEVLNRMLAFMQSSREDDMKRKDTAKQFTEEQKVEEQRRHNEFLKVLKEYTSLGSTTTLVSKKEEEDGGGLFDLFKNSKKLLSLAKLLVPFLINPLTLTIGAVLAAAYGLQKIADFMPNTKVLTPERAQAALMGSEYDIKGMGGYDFLAKRITEGPDEAQKALDDFAEGKISFKELQNLGGETTLKEIASQKGLKVPLRTETQLPSVPPRPDTTGGKNQDRARNWDREFGKTHNPDGTPKVTTTAKPLLSGVEESTAEAGRGTAALDDYRARQLEQETGGKAAFGVKPMGIKSIPIPETVTPVPAAPVSNRMNEAVDENQNLNLQSYDSGSSGSAAPVISSSSSSVDLPDRPIPATATVRDTTPILAHVMQGYMSPV